MKADIEKINLENLSAAFANAVSRVIILDYDNLLMPSDANSMDENLVEALKKVIIKLSNEQRNHLVIITSREEKSLESYLPGLNITLMAEHGCYLKYPGKDWQAFHLESSGWKTKITPSLMALESSWIGSNMEETNHSFIWSYWRLAEKVQPQKKQILAGFHSLPFANEFIIEEHDFAIEFRTKGINRGKFVSRWLNTIPYFDFVLAIGGSKDDEDVFELIDKPNFSVRIGKPKKNSNALFYIEGEGEAFALLNAISNFG